jgi:hypothetical protein
MKQETDDWRGFVVGDFFQYEMNEQGGLNIRRKLMQSPT